MGGAAEPAASSRSQAERGGRAGGREGGKRAAAAPGKDPTADRFLLLFAAPTGNLKLEKFSSHLLLATNRSRTGLQLWCKPRQVTAKTVRNGGSSRAARAVAAAFDGRGRLVGCRFDTLPLDRDRILSPPAADRNYHAFYQLCFGASQAER